MTLRARLTAMALLGVLTTCGLAACGSDESDPDSKDRSSRSSSDPSPDVSEEGGTDPGGTGAGGTDAGGTGADGTGGGDGEGGGNGSGGGDAGGRPSKDEVVTGYTTIVNDFGLGLPPELVGTMVSCFVDQVYDQASAETLRAIAAADMTGGNPDDQQLFTDATLTCQSQVTGG